MYVRCFIRNLPSWAGHHSSHVMRSKLYLNPLTHIYYPVLVSLDLNRTAHGNVGPVILSSINIEGMSFDRSGDRKWEKLDG